jgi:16S rRNA (cytidine1402-2'-O)-methyltransferase
VASKGKIVLVATPIGNLGDLSPRAVEALSQADLWLVEDTRVSGKLQAHLGLKKPMRVLNDHTRPDQVERYIGEIAATGATAAALTDGGTPVISDPGAALVDLALEQDLEVDAIPGPSAVPTALMLSGFYGQRFCFLGFLGRKPGDIRSELEPFADSPITLVLFESPHRIGKMLAVAAEVLGPRRFAICRELTKVHQQVVRGRLDDLAQIEHIPQKGEVSIVLEGKRRRKMTDE